MCGTQAEHLHRAALCHLPCLPPGPDGLNLWSRKPGSSLVSRVFILASGVGWGMPGGHKQTGILLGGPLRKGKTKERWWSRDGTPWGNAEGGDRPSLPPQGQDLKRRMEETMAHPGATERPQLPGGRQEGVQGYTTCVCPRHPPPTHRMS